MFCLKGRIVRKEGFSMSWMGMVNFPVAEGPPSAPSSLILNDGDWLPALGNLMSDAKLSKACKALWQRDQQSWGFLDYEIGWICVGSWLV